MKLTYFDRNVVKILGIKCNSAWNVHDKINGSIIETQGRTHSYEMITIEKFSTPKLQISYKMLTDM